MNKYQKNACKMCKELKKEIDFLVKLLKHNKITEDQFNEKLLKIKRELLSIYFNIA